MLRSPSRLAIAGQLRPLVWMLCASVLAALPISGHAEGGPDAFGYTWTDSSEPTGPDFAWVDISQSGSPLQVGESGYAGPIPLDFPFPFYGEFQTGCFISANGLITFGTAAGTAQGQCFPATAAPNRLIALLWEDLHPASGASVRYLRDAANQRLVIQYHQVLGSCGQPVDVQAILLPGGVIRLQYQSLPTACANAASIGIENGDGSSGLSYHCAQGGGTAMPGLAIQFVPPSPCDELVCAGIPEVEPNNGWEDGQSNAIAGGQTICGALEANAQLVDSDAFRYRHFGGSIQATLSTEDFNGRLRLCEVEAGGAVLAVADQLPRCYDESLMVNNLAPGWYLLVVDHDGAPDVEGLQQWSLTLHGQGHACSEHVPVPCSGLLEVEPNEGWTANPPNSSLGRIQPGEALCGNIQADAQGRDLDWFQLDLAAPADLEIELVPDAFDAVLYFTDLDPSGSVLAEVDRTDLCLPESLSLAAVPAGSYCVVVACQHQELVPEAQNYQLRVSVADSSALCVATPLPSLAEGVLTVQRPAPLSRHQDGGSCGSGFSSLGCDDVFSFQLDQSRDLLITLQGEGMADEALLLFSDCLDSTSCVAVANETGATEAGESLAVQALPAGAYWLVADFIQPDGAAAYQLEIRDPSVGLAHPLVQDFTLQAPHPNPFNPTTLLNWSQSRQAPVRLLVHDLRGALVEAHELGVAAAGTHQVQWDASTLPGGLYLLSLEVAGQRQTQKALLLK